jgi:branched-chain amino acid transport system substrate-binding protein
VSDFGTRASDFCCRALLFYALLLSVSAAEPPGQAPTPFLRFRERALEYTGPEEDGQLKNLQQVNIGWFGPSDQTSHLAGDMWWAANFAVQEANAHGGARGLPIQLVPCWSVNPWGAGVAQLARMIYTDQPLAILGSVDSAFTHLAEQVVAKAQLPLVSPVTTDSSVTLAGVSWMFACAPGDTAIARVLVNDVLAALVHPNDKLVLLACTDHDSRMTAQEALKEFTRRQRLPDFRFDVPPGARGLSEQLTALAQSTPAAVLIIAGAEDAARLVVAVRDKLPRVKPAPPTAIARPPMPGEPAVGPVIFGSQSMGCARFRELAGAAAEGVRFPLLFGPHASATNWAQFTASFAVDHQHTPDYTAVLTYDATRLLIEAIRRGGLNRGRVREALTELSPWNGLAGPIRFDGTGQNVRTNIGMGVMRDGAVVFVKARANARKSVPNTDS